MEFIKTAPSTKFIIFGFFEQAQIAEKLRYQVPIYPYHANLEDSDIDFYHIIADGLKNKFYE